MSPLQEFRGIYPDVHHERISSFFRPSRAERAQGERELAEALGSLKGFYVICFTNRCGSNFLAQSLASEGRLQQAGEPLNHDVVINQSTKAGLKSYPAFLASIVSRGAGRSGIFGCKASAGQLVGLYNAGVLHQVKDRLTLVHITRQNLMEQAVSMLIASRTLRWTSKQEGVDAKVEFDEAVLTAILENICRQNAALKALFELFQVEAVPVQYERLVEEPVKVVRRVGRHLGLQNLKFVPEKVSFEKQADALNAELLARWRALHAIGVPRQALATADEA